ncbi:GNAT family N-acetyltransferase [Maliponia aquimaris]|uniref:N-acetyltransferase domain-containing protein n=1 Tax=Maliponia aquimaris TaxID=1673631 RepID=A0A238L6L5_9RHOB|nr:GNAT family N-acetyltransferase [Maliponia aquimaris]SMX50628.1 hypothetical protein MAA8898_04890 [Maliponia aquimaris]
MTGAAVGGIVTPRLCLRPARATDLEPLHAVLSHPRAMRYWSRAAHDDIAVTRRFLRGLMATDLEYVIARDGRCIGKAGLWQAGELGYILHPDHWGRGLAHEALSALVPHLWRRLPDLKIMTAEVDPRNAASCRVLEKLGFAHLRTEQGNFLYDGHEWCDTAYFALSRPADLPPA